MPYLRDKLQRCWPGGQVRDLDEWPKATASEQLGERAPVLAIHFTKSLNEKITSQALGQQRFHTQLTLPVTSLH